MSTVSEIYSRIGQRIVDSIGCKWLTATLHIKYIGGVKTFLEYQTDNGEVENTVLQDSFKNMRDIKELNAIMTAENDKNKWNKAIFTVTPEGKFNVEFIWDQKLQNKIEELTKE
ncbi:hypothetical protein HQ45_05610 [Porphyromonas crevioricanis]|uniref:DUF600 family protein n=1 Tax=Porphyromonas crevioricanis JCM 15906 TaxID=1305617 RepID=T1CSQ1_9PORP|nr:hypothetical protein [Porphyromonas crevioricanis]KGN90261.1 hypothetical protein HQ45_05610 [Porphyromonas crevioricanis]GAD06203.1 hypothetical protein PORCRE_1926 [Porphyromonas crevioricanis JCM 15906]SJZ95775.1 hypothetical protein SAMN02745203_01399 [Porphyromonas crevioricanis]